MWTRFGRKQDLVGGGGDASHHKPWRCIQAVTMDASCAAMGCHAAAFARLMKHLLVNFALSAAEKIILRLFLCSEYELFQFRIAFDVLLFAALVHHRASVECRQ